MRLGLRLSSLLFVLALILMDGGPAGAKGTASLPFSVADVWPTAVRLLRVDLGYVIKEKDLDAGYLMFEFQEGTKKYKGALELVRVRSGEGRVETQAIVSLPELPRHYETLLADKLAAKVREELGIPPPPPRRKPEEAKRPPDAGPTIPTY